MVHGDIKLDCREEGILSIDQMAAVLVVLSEVEPSCRQEGSRLSPVPPYGPYKRSKLFSIATKRQGKLCNLGMKGDGYFTSSSSRLLT